MVGKLAESNPKDIFFLQQFLAFFSISGDFSTHVHYSNTLKLANINLSNWSKQNVSTSCYFSSIPSHLFVSFKNIHTFLGNKESNIQANGGMARGGGVIALLTLDGHHVYEHVKYFLRNKTKIG